MSSSKKQILAVAALCFAAAGVGFGAYRYLAQPHSIDEPGGMAPEITLNDLTGTPRQLSEWRGKLILVNFWATWCAPCLHEIPMLMDMQQQYGGRGLQVVGAAMDEVEAVRIGAPRLGIQYPVLVGDSEIINAMQALGDQLGALPYSVLINANGMIVSRKHGEFERDELIQLIEQNLPSTGG